MKTVWHLKIEFIISYQNNSFIQNTSLPTHPDKEGTIAFYNLLPVTINLICFSYLSMVNFFFCIITHQKNGLSIYTKLLFA